MVGREKKFPESSLITQIFQFSLTFPETPSSLPFSQVFPNSTGCFNPGTWDHIEKTHSSRKWYCFDFLFSKICVSQGVEVVRQREGVAAFKK